MRGEELCTGLEMGIEMAKRARTEGPIDWLYRGETRRKLIKGAEHDGDVVWLLEVVYEGSLSRKVFEVAAEVFAARATAHRLVLAAEKVLNDIVGSVDDEQYLPGCVTNYRMSEKPALDTVNSLKNRLEGNFCITGGSTETAR